MIFVIYKYVWNFLVFKDFSAKILEIFKKKISSNINYYLHDFWSEFSWVRVPHYHKNFKIKF